MDSARWQRTGSKRTGDWSAIVVNYNGDPFLPACLEALGRVRLRPKDVFVVDNASTDGSLFEMNAYPWAEAIQNERNLGFAGGANVGLARVETSYAVILNPDVELAPEYGDMLVDAFESNPNLGVAGTLLLYPDGETVQHAGGVIHRPSLHTEHRGRGRPMSDEYEHRVDVDYATGAAVALRMEAIREVDGFDERFTPVYYEDVDLSVRIRSAGWDVQLVPLLRGIHQEGVTLEQSRDHFVYLQRNRLRYALTHLSSREWAEEFVPAEIARIRHELAELDSDGLSSNVGIEGVDVLLRELAPLADAGSSVVSVPRYPEGGFNLDELQRLRAVDVETAGSRIPLLGWLRRLVAGLGARSYVDAALIEQRAFNDAVVRALTVQQDRNTLQDYVNRDQTAGLMLFALLTLRRLHDLTSGAASVDDGRERNDPVS